MPGRGILDGATLPAYLPHWIGADDPANAVAVVQVDTGVESGLRFGSQAPVDGAPTASGLILQSRVAGDTNNRFQVAADGTMTWRTSGNTIWASFDDTNGQRMSIGSAPSNNTALVADGRGSSNDSKRGVDAVCRTGSALFAQNTGSPGSIVSLAVDNFAVDIGSFNAATTVGLRITGASSQSGELTQWRSSTPTILLSVLSGGQLKTSSGNESTGSGSALLGANSPAGTLTAPYTWLKFTSSDGSQVYVPAWK